MTDPGPGGQPGEANKSLRPWIVFSHFIPSDQDTTLAKAKYHRGLLRQIVKCL